MQIYSSFSSLVQDMFTVSVADAAMRVETLKTHVCVALLFLSLEYVYPLYWLLLLYLLLYNLVLLSVYYFFINAFSSFNHSTRIFSLKATRLEDQLQQTQVLYRTEVLQRKLLFNQASVIVM